MHYDQTDYSNKVAEADGNSVSHILIDHNSKSATKFNSTGIFSSIFFAHFNQLIDGKCVWKFITRDKMRWICG